MKENNKPEITNVEWGLVIGALFVVDLGQIFLDFILIGLAFNWFIDILVLMSWTSYLGFRVKALGDKWQIFGIFMAFVFGEATGGAAPFWFLDGIYAMLRYKKNSILTQIPGGDIINSTLGK